MLSCYIEPSNYSVSVLHAEESEEKHVKPSKAKQCAMVEAQVKAT